VTTLAVLRGWHILARNFRRPGCEIDIIMERRGILAAVEVKLRQGSFTPELLLAPRKRLALMRGMQSYLALGHSNARTIRFDLAVVGIRNGRAVLRNYTADVFQA
jgi:putative endonuclease